MEGGVIPISDFQLFLSVILVIVTGFISAALKLGLLKPLLWGSFRTFAQLMLIGYALTYIFAVTNPFIIFLIVTIMCVVAAWTSMNRTHNVVKYSLFLSFTALWVSTFLVGIMVVAFIISPEPWYSARIVIPIFGMILGNSMNGIALSLDRLYSEVRSRVTEVEALLSYGASPWEAVRDCVKEAVRAGMTPTINSLMVVGLVSLPGMMTGQILGGADPQQAVRYQIVVMLMIAAAVSIGCLILVMLSYKRLFTREDALLPAIFTSKK